MYIQKKFKAGEMAPNIGVILGTMTFGWSYSSSSIDSKLAGQMVDAYFNAGYNHIDTALTYSGGKTEKIIGELMPAGSDRAAKCGVLATKAGPWEGTATMSGNGGLAPLQLRAKVGRLPPFFYRVCVCVFVCVCVCVCARARMCVCG